MYSRDQTTDGRCQRDSPMPHPSIWKQLANAMKWNALHVWIARIIIGEVVPQYATIWLDPAPHRGGEVLLEARVQNRCEDR